MTNEDIKKQQDLKDVAAGQVPFPVSAAPNSGDDTGPAANPGTELDVAKSLSDTVGGNVPFPVSQASAGDGPSSGGGVDPDPGAGRVSVDDITAAVGGNIAHPVSMSPNPAQGSNPSQTHEPGPSLGIDQLDGTAAGAAVALQKSDAGPPSADPDPLFVPSPENIDSGPDLASGAPG